MTVYRPKTTDCRFGVFFWGKIIYNGCRRAEGEMKVTLEIDARYAEPQIKICAAREDEQVRQLYHRVRQAVDAKLAVYQGREMVFVPWTDIVRIYAQDKRVYCATQEQNYLVHQRLYELEQELDMTQFIRISNSEMVNMNKILRLDASLTGTIRMQLQGGVQTYVSRRYVTKIKKALGI